MTTTLATFADSAFSMRYKEPFITGGLNKKFAVALPAGVYRGFTLEAPGGGDRTVSVVADPLHTDHVAVYLTETGYSLTIRRTGSDFLIDLSSYASEVVIVAIYATYAVGATTAAEIRAYTEAEYTAAAEKDELVVLGMVDVPAASTSVDASMISDNLRTLPWQQRGEGAVAWDPLHRNSSFEWSDVSGAPYENAAAYWSLDLGSGGQLKPSSTNPRTGDKCIELVSDLTSATFVIHQETNVPVAEEQKIRIQLFKWMVQGASAHVEFVLRPYFLDSTGADVAGTDIDIGVSADADYEEVDETIRVPTGLDITHLSYIAIVATGLVFASPATAIRFDDFQVWLETSAEDWVPGRNLKSRLLTDALQLLDPSGDFSDLGAAAQLLASSEGARLERTDQKSGSLVTPVNLELFGRLLDLGSNLLNSDSQKRQPRITAPIVSHASDSLTLLWETQDTNSVVVPVRLYASTAAFVGGGLRIVTNAYWNGTNWVQDRATRASMLVEIGHEIFKVWVKAAGAVPWTFYAWDDSPFYTDAFPTAGSTTAALTGSTELGASMLSTEAEAITPRLLLPFAGNGVATDGRTLMFDMPGLLSTQAGVRFFRIQHALNGMMLEIIFNATWDGADWIPENTSQDCHKLEFSKSGLQLWSHDGGAGSFGDNTWTRQYSFYSEVANYIYLNDKQVRTYNVSANNNPAAGTYITPNTRLAKNIVKSWAAIQVTGTGSATMSNGFNAAASMTGFGGVRVSFPAAMTDGGYAVATQVFSGGTAYHLTVAARALGNVDLNAWVTSSGAFYDLDTNSLGIMVIVIGEQ